MSTVRAARRRGLIIALIAVLVLGLAAWTALAWLLLPYPLYPLEWAYWTGRDVIRVAWAALTGQSPNVDLFPG
jgi:uncharacterized membrane protein YbhN (UPF0104 family)